MLAKTRYLYHSSLKDEINLTVLIESLLPKVLNLLESGTVIETARVRKDLAGLQLCQDFGNKIYYYLIFCDIARTLVFSRYQFRYLKGLTASFAK